MARKILKYTVWILASLAGLLLLAGILVYLPPVQKYVKDKAAGIVAEKTGMRLDIERFRLRFPLTLEIGNTTLAWPDGDTVIGFGRLRADVAVWPLLRKEIRVGGLYLDELKLDYKDSVNAMALKGHVGRLSIESAGVRPGKNILSVGGITLSDADLKLLSGENRQPPDTASSDTGPWKLAVRRLNVERVAFGMETQPEVTVLKTMLQKASVSDVETDLGERTVSAASVSLDECSYSYLTDTLTLSRKEPLPDSLNEPAAPPWSISIGRLELEDNALEYGVLNGSPAAGFDPGHISVTGLNLSLNSIYNKGADISATIAGLSMRERSGLEIRRAEGRFAMDPTGISLSGFALETAASRIKADIDAGAGILKKDPDAIVNIKINAGIASSDVFLLYPANAQVKNPLTGKHLFIDTDISGTLGSVDIPSLSAEMPGNISLKASGNISSVTEPARMDGNIQLNGTFTDIGFVKHMIPDTALRRRIDFPKNMGLSGRVSAKLGTYSPDIRLTADTGRLDLKGRLSPAPEEYDIQLAAHAFPLYKFLPADSLGLLTAGISASGRGFDPAADKAGADIKADIGRFDYKGYDYGGMALEAILAEHKLSGKLSSGSEALKFGLAVNGELNPGSYDVNVNGRIEEADLLAMRFSETPLRISGNIDIAAGIRPDTLYKADITVDSVRYTQGAKSYSIGKSTVNASADSNSVSLKAQSGDLALNLSVQAGLDSLAAAITRTGETIRKQIQERDIDIAAVERAMPPLQFDLQAGQANVFHSFMKNSGVDFSRVSVRAASGEDPLKAVMLVNGLKTAGITFDTLNAGLSRRDSRLDYFLRLANRPGNTEQLALIYLYGNLQHDTARANIVQKNRSGETGFKFGLDARLQDSGIGISMLTEEPVLAYAQWTVNEGNYITYRFDKKLDADFILQSGERLISIRSAGDAGMPEGSIRADIRHIEIRPLLDIMPSPPPVSGLLNVNAAFGTDKDFILMNGGVDIQNMYYNKRRVGDVSVLMATNADHSGSWNFDGSLKLDAAEVLTAKGAFASGDMDLILNMPGLALNTVSAFLPPDAAELSGSLSGSLTARGPVSKLLIDGELGFNDGRVTVPMIGTTFGISPEKLTFDDSRLAFNDWGLVSPNKRKLSVDGTVDFKDLSKITADLAVSAAGFEAVNSSRGGGSPVYGKAVLDADINATGQLDALRIRGGVRILSNTDIVYTMTDSPLETADLEQHIVTFVSFADSAAVASVTADSLQRIRTSGMDVLLNADIDEGAQATINLTKNGSNRIELVGGGSLTYSVNTQGDTRFAGRYTLSGGTVVYSPPIISEKSFAVADGSYVEWTGDMLNPAFNIKAVDKLRAKVTTDNDSRNVTFEVSINITNSLSDMDMAFDLAAPSDAAIQNQLSSLAPEQRSSQAMALLVYNTYTGPGATGKVDANNPLNTFISRELNQWARNNLKGVDLSVGINTVEDAAGGSHTDYSYKVSKNLFNDRVKVSIGGNLNDNADSESVKNNFVDDISIEYRLARRDNMFLKAYRYNTQESILEGEVVETGGGFVVRKKMNHLKELFRLTPDPEKKKARQYKREIKKKMREDKERQQDEQKEREALPPPTGQNITDDE